MVRVGGRRLCPDVFARARRVSLTTNVVPLAVLVGLLDQPGGLHLAVSTWSSSGQRVRRGSGYPPLYSTLLADRPAAGPRSTRLVVRLDIPESVAGSGLPALDRRGGGRGHRTHRQCAAPAGDSGGGAQRRGTRRRAGGTGRGSGARPARRPDSPTTDACGRRGRGRRCRVGAAALRRPYGPAAPGARGRVRWRTVRPRPGYLTNYYFSPEDITTAALNQMWALRSDDVVQTTSLRKDRTGHRDDDAAVLVSALVRTNDPQPPPQPPTLYLNPLPGDQYAATLRAAPTARPQLKRAGPGPGWR